MPTGYGEYGYHQSAKKSTSTPKPTGVFGTIGNAITGAAQNANKAYLQQLQDYIYGQQQIPMGGGGGGGSRGGGGGGGGGASAYEKWQIAQEEKRQAELQRRKLELTQGLQNARKASIPLLNQYSNQYNKDIGGVFNQNRGLNNGYNQQLAAIAAQMRGGVQSQQNMLRQDLGGQGAVNEIGAMNQMAGQNMQGINYMDLLGRQYNTQLAQAMAAAQADAQSMGAAIKASGMNNLENSYANQLAQIGLLGLT